MSAFARSYAQAFLGVATPGYDVADFLERADAIRKAVLTEPRLKGFFAAPAIPAPVKQKVMEELAGKAGLDPFGSRFFQVLLQHRRLFDVGPILQSIRAEADRLSGVVQAVVTVATPMTAVEKEKIAAALGRVVGRRVRLTMDVDEKILGGFVARVGSEMFDASIRRAIEQFQEQSGQGARA